MNRFSNLNVPKLLNDMGIKKKSNSSQKKIEGWVWRDGCIDMKRTAGPWAVEVEYTAKPGHQADRYTVCVWTAVDLQWAWSMQNHSAYVQRDSSASHKTWKKRGIEWAWAWGTTCKIWPIWIWFTNKHKMLRVWRIIGCIMIMLITSLDQTTLKSRLKTKRKTKPA